MHFVFITLFPEMFPGTLGHSLAGKALAEGKWSYECVSLRELGLGKHQQVDDEPYGGGAGMVLRADVMERAVETLYQSHPEAYLCYLSPRGKRFDQPAALEFTKRKTIAMICGRFEGIDERVLSYYQIPEISIGDVVLSGGELAAQLIADACVRLLPGVVGAAETHAEESFAPDSGYSDLLEYPHYTRPPEWQGLQVPEVLRSGNHQQIASWRKAEAERITQERRPDLWGRYQAAKRKKE